MISFHVECARRANYFMEVDRVERERFYRIFCEKHRPLKIVKELEEKDRQTVEEVLKFGKVIDKCMEIQHRCDSKSYKVKRVTPFTRQQAQSHHRPHQASTSNQLGHNQSHGHAHNGNSLRHSHSK